jgi:hypothetical protein
MSLPSGEIRGWVLIAIPELRGEVLRRPSRHRHPIDVREEIEHQPLGVGRDVDRHPRAFGRREADFAGFPTGLSDVPGWCLWRGLQKQR